MELNPNMTNSMNEVHDYDREFELNNQKLQESEDVSDANKQALSRFVDKCFAEGIGKSTVRKYISNFHTMLKMVDNEFELLDTDREDLEHLLAKVNQSDYSPSTKKGFKVAIKKFYKVMEGGGERYPKKVGFITANIPANKKPSKDSLSEEEINKIIQECRNDRDRAMYKLMYEGGLRPGELIDLTIGDIEFCNNGVRVHIENGKTGNRTILVIESERYLKNWLSKHPFHDNRDAPLWVKVDGRNVDSDDPEDRAIGYNYMRLNLKRKAGRAGVRPDNSTSEEHYSEITPHIFRHSRATHVATEMKEATMKEYFGWTQGSNMVETYVHMSGRDVDSEVLKMYGMEEEEEENEPRTCPRCTKEYQGNENFCPNCSSPLNQEDAIKQEKAKNKADNLADALLEQDITEEDIEKIREALTQ
jgi:integrase/recombinase XerD